MSLNQSKKLLWPVFAFMLLAACTRLESFREDDSLILDEESTSASISERLTKGDIPDVPEGCFRLFTLDTISARTELKYRPFGNFPGYERTITSPSYTSYLVYTSGDIRHNGCMENAECLFIKWDTMHRDSTRRDSTVTIDGQLLYDKWDPYSYVTTKTNNTKASNEAVATSQAEAAVARNYAIIISGGTGKLNNYSRYWNDCQYIYKRLTQSLGYKKNNIYCLVADGTNPEPDMMYKIVDGTPYFKSSPLDFDNNGTNDITYAATKSDISYVFNQLKNKKNTIDHLLIFVTGHGSDSKNICLWDDQITPDELETELGKLPNVKMDIVMGQGYSGNYSIPLTVVNNRTIATACSRGETSFGQGAFTYDTFLRAWTDAFNPKKKAKVDTNSDNMVSLWEAFEYAKANDSVAASGGVHPEYQSTPIYYGHFHDLQGTYYDPVITGESDLQGGNEYTYTISGLPASVTVNWVGLGEISLSSPTNTSVKVRSTLPSDEYISSYPASVMAKFTYNGTELWASKHINSIWNYGYYFNQDYIKYVGPGRYTVYTGFGATGYQWVCSNPYFTIWPPQGSREVEVSGPYTGEPVILWVTFQNPFGEGITVGQEIQQTLNL